MPGSLTNGSLWNRWRGTRSRHSRRMRNPQFYVSCKRPIALIYHRQGLHYSEIRHGHIITSLILCAMQFLIYACCTCEVFSYWPRPCSVVNKKWALNWFIVGVLELTFVYDSKFWHWLLSAWYHLLHLCSNIVWQYDRNNPAGLYINLEK